MSTKKRRVNKSREESVSEVKGKRRKKGEEKEKKKLR